MSDPFDKVSIHKSTDVPRGAHVQELLGAAVEGRKGDWCICRFVNATEDKTPTHGWPLRWPTSKNWSMSLRLDNLGWNEGGEVAFMSEDEALEELRNESRSQTKISFDRAVHVRHMLWRVLVYSHYDGSTAEIYRGKDYERSRLAYGAALGLCKQDSGSNYLCVTHEGVAALADIEGLGLPARNNPHAAFPHPVDCLCGKCLVGGLLQLGAGS